MSKNTHLEHLEDSILFDGSQGAKDAFMFLDELAQTFSGKQKNTFKITTKWDGAPAIFCGTYPGSSRFFVGTKSVFNKNAKINFRDTDIDVNHGHAPGLVSKLKDALKYFPALGISGVAQGDLLFTDDKKYETINGERCITFTPNTITYYTRDLRSLRKGKEGPRSELSFIQRIEATVLILCLLLLVTI